MTNEGSGTSFDATVGGDAIVVSARIDRVELSRLDCSLHVGAGGGMPAGDVFAALCVSERETFFAIVCDHRVDPPQPGLVPSRWLETDDLVDTVELDELEPDELVPVWRRVIEALATGRAEVPPPDGAFPGAFVLDPSMVRTWEAADVHVGTLPVTDEEVEAGSAWGADCTFRVATHLTGHHLVWETRHLDTVPGDSSGDLTGWATFARGVGLTSFREGDSAVPAFLCFSADAPPPRSEALAAWRVAWGYAVLAAGGVSAGQLAERDAS
jgi:hypothetical protein